MDLEIFIHGVPNNGRKIWGKNEDLPYFRNFHAISDNEKTKFLIEFRNLNGRNYCYYTYLKSQNIIAFNGRSGSYFGISIRIEAYCADFINMYRLMDVVYNKYVIGSVLSQNGENQKYLTPDFYDDICSRIEQAIKTLIRNLFNDNEFRNELQKIPIVNSNQIGQFNIQDCTKENVWNLLMKDGKIAISPEFQTQKEYNLIVRFGKEKENIIASKNAEIQSVCQEYEVKVNELQKLLEEEKTAKNLSSRKLREQLDRDRLNYESKIKRLEGENQKLRSTINSVVNAVKEFVSVPQVTSQIPSGINSTETKKQKDISRPNEEIEKSKKFSLKQLFFGNQKNPAILIRDERKGQIKANKPYIIEIHHVKNTERGKWNILNAKILEQDEKHCVIKTDQIGVVEIQYYQNDLIVAERKIYAYEKV